MGPCPPMHQGRVWGHIPLPRGYNGTLDSLPASPSPAMGSGVWNRFVSSLWRHILQVLPLLKLPPCWYHRDRVWHTEGRVCRGCSKEHASLMMTPDVQAPTISDTWQSCSSSLGPEPSYNEHARGNSLFLIYGQQILCMLVAASALTQLEPQQILAVSSWGEAHGEQWVQS